MEVIRSNKGKPKLLFKNYAYLIKHQKMTSIGIALKKGYPAKAASKQLMTEHRVAGLFANSFVESATTSGGRLSIASIRRVKLFKTIANSRNQVYM